MKRFRVPVLVVVSLLAASGATLAIAQDGGAHGSTAQERTALRAPHPQYKGTPETVPPNGGFGDAIALCPVGQAPTGFGFETVGPGMILKRAAPDERGYILDGYNPTPYPVTLTAIVICTAR
ncbi:hypothetical protein [Streptomyces sp. BF23-19]|uniref:hypothetical protein n=1 Tax=unclassified Streptomyces TaxID=2593676 RepID=UPI0034E5DBAC